MKKKLLFLVFILGIDCCGFYYVVKVNEEKKVYPITELQEALLINTKELEFETFQFEDYFYLKHIKDYKYELNNQLEIQYVDLKNNVHTTHYKYTKIEPIVEEEIEEAVVQKPIVQQERPSIQEEKPIEPVQIEPYFRGYHDITVSLESSLDHLVSLLTKDIQSNQNVSINYVSVNLSSVGSYPVYYYVGSETYTINVYVE